MSVVGHAQYPSKMALWRYWDRIVAVPILEAGNRRSIPGPIVITQEVPDSEGGIPDRRIRANVYPFYGPDPLLEENFETGGFESFWTEAYVDTDYYDPNTAEDYIVSSPKYAGAYAAHIYIVSGETEQQPIKLSLWPSLTSSKDIFTLLGSRREIYIEFQQYFTTGYPWPDGSQKIVQCGYFDANKPVPTGDSSQDWEVMFTVNGDNGGAGDGSDGNKWHMAQFINNHGTGTHWVLTDSPAPNFEVHDTWVKNALHLKMNSAAGVSDGFLRWYQNDVNILTSVDSPYLWPGDINAVPLADSGVVTHDINSISIGLNYSMTTGNVSAQPGHRYLDNIKIYATKP